MQRIQALIDKLKEQHAQSATAAELLVTVQQLQQELLILSKPAAPKTLGTSKVSVMMPANVSADVYRNYAPQPKEEKAEPVKQVVPEPVTYNAIDTRYAQAPAVPRNVYAPVPETAPVEQVPDQKETLLVDDGKLSIVQENGQLDMVFDPLTDIPTLSQQFNDKRTPGGESLNDKLKQGKTEVLEFLKDTPVKDLRKAIGINDRFSFINELFRGDEAMYERSIKTINGFNIFPEAEYWITRELKTKLGWNPENEVALHFDQLVRRRFS